MKEKLGGEDTKTNFENDKRRASNPFREKSSAKEFEYEKKPKRGSVAQPRRVGIIS
jgi:general stress protein YciG